MRAIAPVGRALFALIFIASAVSEFSSAGIAQAAAHGVPLAALVVPVSGILALVGGVLVMLGYRARFGAFLLVVFLIPVTLVMHRFWGVSDPQMAMIQKAMFMKNVSMLGGALLIVYFGSGPISLDS